MSRPARELAEAVLALLDSGRSRAEVARAVAAYLVAERRVRDLDAVMREVSRLRQQRSGIVEASVASAYPLDASVLADIRRLVLAHAAGARDAILDISLDRTLLGGVLVSTADFELDATVRGKLKRLKHLSAPKGSM